MQETGDVQILSKTFLQQIVQEHCNEKGIQATSNIYLQVREYNIFNNLQKMHETICWRNVQRI